MQVNFQTTLSVTVNIILNQCILKNRFHWKRLFITSYWGKASQKHFLIIDSLIGGVFSALWGL